MEVQNARRRTHLYRLLSRYFHEPVDADLLRELHTELEWETCCRPRSIETLRLAAALARTIGTPAGVRECRDEFDRLVQLMTPLPTAPEHPAAELQVMSVLCLAETQAWSSKCPREAYRLLRSEAEFLDAHLVRWLPAMGERVSALSAHPVCVGVAQFIASACSRDHAVITGILARTGWLARQRTPGRHRRVGNERSSSIQLRLGASS